jgi:hypothetical protein
VVIYKTSLLTRLQEFIAPRYIIAACVGACLSLLVVGLCSGFSHDQTVVNRIVPGDGNALKFKAEVLASCITLLDFGLQSVCLGLIGGVISIAVFDGLRATLFKKLLLSQSISLYAIGLLAFSIPAYIWWGSGLISWVVNSSHPRYSPAAPLQVIEHPGEFNVTLPDSGRYKVYYVAPQLRLRKGGIAICSLQDAKGRLIPLHVPSHKMRESSNMNYVAACEFVVDSAQTVRMKFISRHKDVEATIVPEGRNPYPDPDPVYNSILVAGCQIEAGSKLTWSTVNESSPVFWKDLPADAAWFADLDNTDWVARRQIQAGEPILCRDFTRTPKKPHI